MEGDGVGADVVGETIVGLGCGAGASPLQRRHASPVRPEHDCFVLTGLGVSPLHLRQASPVRPEHDGGGVHSLTEPGN